MQGAAKLSVEAVEGVVSLIESAHSTILRFGGFLGDTEKPLTGISGFVYRMIRLVTRLVGFSIEKAFSSLTYVLKDTESSPNRDAVLSVVNGIFGDYLATKGNTLAIEMRLRVDGKPIGFSELLERTTHKKKLLLMVHGLCMNDIQWNRKEHDHGKELSKSLNAVPVYLHYNSGKHISENGKQLSAILKELYSKLSNDIELSILAHSMGGLVTRSALHYAQTLNHSWSKNLNKVIFLGTPHHGALLEKGGNWIDILLDSNPYTIPFSRIGKIRSSGITDLRHSFIVDEDWKDKDRFEFNSDSGRLIPLPEGMAFYAIAAVTSQKSNLIGNSIVGDGLVTLKSAFSDSKSLKQNLNIHKDKQWVKYGINHMELLNDKDVYQQIESWLKVD